MTTLGRVGIERAFMENIASNISNCQAHNT